MNSEYNPPILISHSQTEQPFRVKYTIKNPIDNPIENQNPLDKTSNDYITNHEEKFCLFLIKCNFKLIFNKDFSKSIHIETDFYHITSLINLKRFLLYHIEDFIEKGQLFSHIDEMNITTINDKIYVSYKYYFQHPMPMVERRLNMAIGKIPHLIKSLNRSHIHPSIRKYSYIR